MNSFCTGQPTTSAVACVKMGLVVCHAQLEHQNLLVIIGQFLEQNHKKFCSRSCQASNWLETHLLDCDTIKKFDPP